MVEVVGQGRDESKPDPGFGRQTAAAYGPGAPIACGRLSLRNRTDGLHQGLCGTPYRHAARPRCSRSCWSLSMSANRRRGHDSTRSPASAWRFRGAMAPGYGGHCAPSRSRSAGNSSGSNCLRRWRGGCWDRRGSGSSRRHATLPRACVGSVKLAPGGSPSAIACSFASDSCSICRTRSALTPSAGAISLSVSPRRPRP